MPFDKLAAAAPVVVSQSSGEACMSLVCVNRLECEMHSNLTGVVI